MGARLLAFYEKTGKEFGYEGRMKLALLTAISSSKAAAEADSPANIQKFEDAVAQLCKTKKLSHHATCRNYSFRLAATHAPSERSSTRIRPRAASSSIHPVRNAFTGPGAPCRLSFGHSPAKDNST